MVALNLLPKDCCPSPAKLARRVESALADAAVLHDYDDALDALDGDPAKLARAHRHRAMWREWLDEADPIYGAAKDVEGLDPERLRELFIERCVAEAVLRQTPEEEARHYRDARDRVASAASSPTGSGARESLDDVRQRIADWRRATGIPKPATRRTTRRVGRHVVHVVEPL